MVQSRVQTKRKAAFHRRIQKNVERRSKYYSFLSEFLSAHRFVLYFVAFFFFLAIMVGVASTLEMKMQIMEELADKIEEIMTSHQGLLFWRIFYNNLLVGLLSLGAGVTIFLTLLVLLSNGAMLGIVFSLAGHIVPLQNNGWLTIIVGVVPHGIFEIPAILFAAALGLIIGLKLWLGRRYCAEYTRLEVIKRALILFVVIVVPFLFIAAAIETFVTPTLVDVVAGEDPYHMEELEVLLMTDEFAAQFELAPGEEESVLEYYAAGNMTKKVIMALLFNESVYDYLAEVRVRPYYGKTWESDNASISLTVREFADEASAIDAARRETRILAYLVSNHDPVVREVGGTYYISIQDREIAILTEGRYLLEISSTGIDSESIEDIAKLHRGLLSERSIE